MSSYYFKYNDIDLTDLVGVRTVEANGLPVREVSSIDAWERIGSIFNGVKNGDREISITFLVKVDRKQLRVEPTLLDDVLQDIKMAFYTDSPAPLFLGREDRFIYAILKDDFVIDELGEGIVECTVTLLCNDPLWYDAEIDSIDSDVKTFTVENEGNLDTYPVIGIGISGDSSFVQLENKTTGEKILIGDLPSVEKKTAKKNDLVLVDNMTSTSGWVQTDATIDAGRATGGTIGVSNSGDSLICSDFGSSSSDATWHGACYRKNITSTKNFKVRARMRHNSTGKNGDPTIRTPYEDDNSQIKTGVKETFYQVTKKSGAVFRSSPDNKSDKVFTLKYGYKIKADTYEVQNGWLKYEHAFKTGYIKTSGYGISKKTATNRVTLKCQNFVTTKKTILRSTANSSGKAVKTIPAGKCIRCIYSEKYPKKEGVDQEKFYKLAKKYDGKDGYVLIENLVEASEYKIEYDEVYETADDKTGVNTLYGFSADGTQLFSLSMIDDNKYYDFAYPLIRKNSSDFLKDKTVAPNPKMETTYSGSTATKKYVASGRYGDWNEFYGELYIERVNNKWYAYVKKIKSGETVKMIKSKTVTDKENSDKNLDYLVMYIGTTDSAEKACAMSQTLIEIKKDVKSEVINPDDNNWQDFEKGDIILIDCSEPAVYLNDNEAPELIDVGSEFFDLVPGDNEIRLVTDDVAPITTVMFNKKYL